VDDDKYSTDGIQIEIHSTSYEVPPKKPASRNKKWVLIGLLLGLPLFFAFFPIVMLDSCMHSDDAAMELLKKCPEATAALGDNIEVDWWPGCGSMEMNGGMERTSWMLPVRGSKGKGLLYYHYDGTEGVHSIGGMLDVDGEEINLGLCSIQDGPSPLDACNRAFQACKNVAPSVQHMNCENLLKADAVTCNRALSTFTKADAADSAKEAGAPRKAEEQASELCAKANKCCMDVQKKKKKRKRNPEKCEALLKNTDTKKCEGALNGYRDAAEAYGLRCD
jgi:hypothetical protein